MSYFFIAKILWTFFGYFRHDRLYTPKVILSIYTKLLCLSVSKKSTSSPYFSENWPSAFWPITREPELFQIWDWWWNTNNNISFPFRLYPRTNDKIFQKIQKKNLGQFGPFCSNLVKNTFSCKRGHCQFLNIPIIYHHVKNLKKTNEPFLRKMMNWCMGRQTDRQTDRQQ